MTTYFDVYQYLGTWFQAIVEEYGKALEVHYGQPTPENVAMQISLTDTNWENYETSSWADGRIAMDEEYVIEAGITVAQGDSGTELDLVATASQIFDLIDEEIRDSKTLGNRVDFVQCKPVSVQTRNVAGGLACLFRFDVKCSKQLR